jgi:hypothetical protein
VEGNIGVCRQPVVVLFVGGEVVEDDMDFPMLKPILRRQMEVYAGFMEYTDHHQVRRLTYRSLAWTLPLGWPVPRHGNWPSN